MNLTLTRKQFRPDGIFSELRDQATGTLIAVSLEHAYFCGGDPAFDSKYAPKIPLGTYTCKRGKHRLHGMAEDFETFEITGVDGHTNLLFHWGNFNKDSEGCVLLGDEIAPASSDGTQMILHSKAVFAQFMSEQVGVDEFKLLVTA